ncbi:MAG: YfcE family phosphodiesterase [Spirochaetes bacterium]|jgi:putative phosphoesterase|nr:YfcE family phosphodiesterase [Spirochaetota bacterium]
MKTIVAVSDSHGNPHALSSILTQVPDVDLFVFCGDGIKDIAFLPFSDFTQIIAVPGNIDRDSLLYTEDAVITDVFGIKIAVTHGHRHGVKHSLGGLMKLSDQHECRIVFYGHTHEQGIKQYEERLLINPGVANFGQFAVVQINGTVIEARLHSIDI